MKRIITIVMIILLMAPLFCDVKLQKVNTLEIGTVYQFTDDGNKEIINKSKEYFQNQIDDDDDECPTLERFNEIRQIILKTVPGDIIRYDNSHIGIITNIDYERIERANSFVQIFENITVIESFYGSYFNYVFKRNMMNGINFTNNDGFNFNKGSWFYDWGDNPSMRNFAIDRLLLQD